MSAPMLARRHGWVSPGRIPMVGSIWPLTVRVVGALLSMLAVGMAPFRTWKSILCAKLGTCVCT